MKFSKRIYSLGSTMLAAILLLSACSNPAPINPVPSPSPEGLGTPVIPITATETDTAVTQPTPTIPSTPTPTPAPSVWVEPGLPASYLQAFQGLKITTTTSHPESADVRLEVEKEEADGAAGTSQLRSQWIYALVAPYPTIPDGVTREDLHKVWEGDLSSSPFAGQPIYMDDSTLAVFTARWGAPVSQAIKLVPTSKLLDEAWKHRPSWAFVPFEEVEARWKVLEVDGQSPLRKNFEPAGYALTVPIVVTGESAVGNPLAAEIAQALPATNRDPDKLTTVILTGVTALVRGTSNTMYAHGVDYPAQYIGDLLREADILHISNEVPFAKNCPAYVQFSTKLVFCTYPKYIQLLEDIGTDVVELTGDHFADWGPQATLYTLQLYKDRGWPYYGGGANLKEAELPVLIENHGNKIAFIGCNAKGGGYATASDMVPGAAECDYPYMHAEIARLRSEGYLVISTFQHQEDYRYTVKPEYRLDFTGMADAGAVIVSGSQAHQPQNMEFYGGSFIHYGLGNLFFDQITVGPETSQAFIDRHVFYNGRYLGTELITVQFVDMARSRPMTPEERASFLQVIFKASGW